MVQFHLSLVPSLILGCVCMSFMFVVMQHRLFNCPQQVAPQVILAGPPVEVVKIVVSDVNMTASAIESNGFTLAGTPAAEKMLRNAQKGTVKMVSGIVRSKEGKLLKGNCTDSGALQPNLLAIEPLEFDPRTCKKIYLDIGSNQGIQLRKLFNGERPNTPWAQKFREYFGDDTREDVCAFAFEADRMHKSQHEKLHKEWKKRSLRVQTLFHPVWANVTVMNFYERQEPQHENWGSTLSNTGNSLPCTAEVQVLTLDLAKFMRLIREDAIVVAKMDIEGAEFVVLRELMLQGQLCDKIDFLGIEIHKDSHGVGDFHRKYNTVALDIVAMQALLGGPTAFRKCKCRMEDLDDE